MHLVPLSVVPVRHLLSNNSLIENNQHSKAEPPQQRRTIEPPSHRRTVQQRVRACSRARVRAN